jgi:O-antigen/teichoic acid export membrane protein
LKNIEINKYLKKSFITGSLKTITVSVVTLGLLPLIISSIGMDRYGLVSITMLFGSGIILVDLGISKAVTLLLGKTDDPIENNNVVADASLLTIGMLLVLGVSVMIVILFDVPILGSSLNIERSLYNYIVFIGFSTLVVMMINMLCIAILEAYLLMHFVNIGHGLSSVAMHIFLLLGGILNFSDYVLVSIPCISSSLVTVYFLITISKKTVLRPAKPSVRRSKKIIPISLKFLSISLVSATANPFNKYALVFLSGNPTIIGIYDISLKIASIATSLLNNLSQPLFGLFAKMTRDSGRVFDTAKRIAVLIFMMYCIGLVSYLAVGRFIAEFIDINNSSILYSASFVLLAGISFHAVSEPLFRALIGLSFLKEAMYFKSSIIVFNLILFLVFVRFEPLSRIIYSYSLSISLSTIVIILGAVNISKKASSL